MYVSDQPETVNELIDSVAHAAYDADAAHDYVFESLKRLRERAASEAVSILTEMEIRSLTAQIDKLKALR